MTECCSRPYTIPNINALCAATKKFQGQNNFLLLFHCLFFLLTPQQRPQLYNYIFSFFLSKGATGRQGERGSKGERVSIPLFLKGSYFCDSNYNTQQKDFDE